jgi:hypothetical protein
MDKWIMVKLNMAKLTMVRTYTTKPIMVKLIIVIEHD